jgi:ferredoxin-NADP reductase
LQRGFFLKKPAFIFLVFPAVFQEFGLLTMQQQDGFYKALRIREVRDEAKDFKTIVFEDDHNISYKPGQYLTLVRFERGEELRRSYSITSSPALKEPLSIGVKRVENGVFSRHLVDHAKSGDELLTTGSGGFFVLPDDVQAFGQLFFFAAGSGITPVYSLIKTALHLFTHLSIVLVYSNASVERTIFLSGLQRLQQRFSPRFQIEFCSATQPTFQRQGFTVTPSFRCCRHMWKKRSKRFSTSAGRRATCVCAPTRCRRAVCRHRTSKKKISISATQQNMMPCLRTSRSAELF